MNKETIINQLTTNHNTFESYINSLTDSELVFQKEGKWSAAQQVQHIYKSLKPLALGLQLPKFIIKTIWGKANRNSKTYEELVQKYLNKLTLGGKASKPFVPKTVAAKDVMFWNKKVEKALVKLVKNIQNFSESEMDIIVLPHPLLGKVTMREMLYFTIYHVQHHQHIVQRDLK
jgi:hypothetical protein